MESTVGVLEYLREALEVGGGVWSAKCDDFDSRELIDRAPNFGLQVRMGNEGAVSKVDNLGAPGDFSRTGNDFDFHSDGLYQDPLPDIVALFCVNPGSKDTVTILSDGIAAIESLSTENVEIGKMLSGVYIGRDGEKFSRPLFVEHPQTQKLALQIPSRGYLRPTKLVPSQGGHITVRDISEFTHSLLGALQGHVILEKMWEAGDLVFFDNLRFPHARKSGSGLADPTRLLRRIWLDHAHRYEDEKWMP